MKIEKLTSEQEIALQETLKKWLTIGRRTDRLDRDAATNIVNRFYKEIGKKEPQVLFFSSPIMCILAYALLSQVQLMDQLRDQLKYQLWDKLKDQIRVQLWDKLGGQLRDQIGDQLKDQIRVQLWDKLGGQLRDQLMDQLMDQLKDQLKDQLWDKLWDKIKDQLKDQLWDKLWDKLRVQLSDQLGDQIKDQLVGYFAGNQWCYADVIYDFCNSIGVNYSKDQLEKLRLWIDQSAVCHWWWPYEGFVLMSDHPVSINTDDKGRLHKLNDFALKYSDGYGIYSLHGVRVPEKYVLTEPDKINIEEVLKEPSAEVRMAVLGKVGLSNALGKIPHKVIDSKNGNDLVEFIIEGEQVRGLIVRWTDKLADKTTVLPVPKTIEEFKDVFCDEEYPDDYPDNPDDCEQVRVSTFRGFIHEAKQEAKKSGKHWMEMLEWQAET